MKVSYIVTLELPADVGIEEGAAYIRDEVRAGCGGRSPDDPLFHLNRDSVKVKRCGKRSTRRKRLTEAQLREKILRDEDRERGR